MDAYSGTDENSDNGNAESVSSVAKFRQRQANERKQRTASTNRQQSGNDDDNAQAAQESDSTEQESLTVENVLPFRGKRTRGPSSNAKPSGSKSTTKKSISVDDAKVTANMLLMMLQTLAVNLAGSDASLNTFERQLIEPTLTRILQRGTGPSEKIAAYIDPLTLMIGFTMWGSRILSVRKQAAQMQSRIPVRGMDSEDLRGYTTEELHSPNGGISWTMPS